jgi:hypothetical protein
MLTILLRSREQTADVPNVLFRVLLFHACGSFNAVNTVKKMFFLYQYPLPVFTTICKEKNAVAEYDCIFVHAVDIIANVLRTTTHRLPLFAQLPAGPVAAAQILFGKI